MKAPSRDGWFWPLVFRATVINRLLATGVPVLAVQVALAEISEASVVAMDEEGASRLWTARQVLPLMPSGC